MHTVAIISRKGGAGKTNVAVHLAACAEGRGMRAGIVDPAWHRAIDAFEAHQRASLPRYTGGLPTSCHLRVCIGILKTP